MTQPSPPPSPPDSAAPAEAGSRGPGLRAKLVALLLLFGLVPLIAFILIGYAVSRGAIIRQAQNTLQALSQLQAVHLTTELERERLLLRTIAGQLPPAHELRRAPTVRVQALLTQALPEGGVFDGLRLVTGDGAVLGAVALRHVAPHWPPEIPAADWTAHALVVHREGVRVLAFLVATPLPGSPDAWLEGHVRREDFRQVFALGDHLTEGVESAVYEATGRPVFGLHDHATDDLAAFAPGRGETTRGPAPAALVSTAPVATTDWTFVAALPYEVALAPLARLRNTAFAVLAGLVLLTVFTGVFAARSVTTPLHQLATAVRRFGKEGEPPVITPRGRDEVATLMDAFNRMTADLERSRAEIDALHARDLERAQQLATVGELASGVAHEIRNPLTGVRGALDLALRGLPGDGTHRPLLEEAQHQLTRIESATTQLLRFARPPELREVAVDANLLVERAMYVVAAPAVAAGVTLTSEASDAAVPVWVDPELIVQVLVNLMLNAIDAMASGGVLTVGAARHGPDVWIGVQDTGAGIPADIRSQIFRPFYTTKHHGTGLGLPISRQIVERHHGALRVEDTPGGGATFIVALPLAPSEESPS
jgi:signal transduction histidine kinase